MRRSRTPGLRLRLRDLAPPVPATIAAGAGSELARVVDALSLVGPFDASIRVEVADRSQAPLRLAIHGEVIATLHPGSAHADFGRRLPEGHADDTAEPGAVTMTIRRLPAASGASAFVSRRRPRRLSPASGTVSGPRIAWSSSSAWMFCTTSASLSPIRATRWRTIPRPVRASWIAILSSAG
jgi:hypothetical protein